MYGVMYHQVILSFSKRVNITHDTSNSLVLLHTQGTIIALDVDRTFIVIIFLGTAP